MNPYDSRFVCFVLWGIAIHRKLHLAHTRHLEICEDMKNILYYDYGSPLGCGLKMPFLSEMWLFLQWLLSEEVTRKDKLSSFLSLPACTLPPPNSCSRFPFQISRRIILVYLAMNTHKAACIPTPAHVTLPNLLQQLLAVAPFQQILGIHFLLHLRYLPAISPSAFCQSMTLKSLLP